MLRLTHVSVSVRLCIASLSTAACLTTQLTHHHQTTTTTTIRTVHSRTINHTVTAATPITASTTRTPRPSIRLLRSDIHEPFFNIATEEKLLASHVAHPPNQPAPVDHTLFIWSNPPCVIMGKHQNPYREVHLQALRENKVELVRRKSGGGCVYQDLGNAIFTFISRDTPEAKEQHNDILLKSLSSMGIAAKTSGRNDIEVDGRKISGCAFKRERGWLLHHGTMLINVDMQALPQYLNPSKAKLLAKGVASVASRVVNLQQLDASITRPRWEDVLADTFRAHHGYGTEGDNPSTRLQILTDMDATLKNDPELERIYSGLRSFQWIYGSSPEFSHEFTKRFEGWGSVDIGFKVSKGHIIENVNIYSDSLQPQMIEIVKQALLTLKEEKKPYGREEIERVLIAAEATTREQVGADAGNNVKEMKEWLLTHL